MAPSSVLTATALFSTIALTVAHPSQIYARSYDDSISSILQARSSQAQKILARRAFEEIDEPWLHARHEPCGLGCLCARSAQPLYMHPEGCLCARHLAREAEADADADPIGDAMFEHDDILFNYKRSEGEFFDDLEFFDLVSRDIDSRDADPEADADADAIGDAMFEHDDILFNYKRSAEPEGESFFEDIEFSDLISRSPCASPEGCASPDAEAEADPIGDAMFEHDDILFNYRRSLDSDPFEDIEFSDLISRSPCASPEGCASPNPAAEAEADPIGDAMFEHDDILFNYHRRDLDPFDEVEFTDLVSRSPCASPEGCAAPKAIHRRSLDPFDEVEFTDLISRSPCASPEGCAAPRPIHRRAAIPENEGFVNWAKSPTAQGRKGEYKSPGALAAEEQASRSGGRLIGGGGSGGQVSSDGSANGNVGDGVTAAAGGMGGHAFNEALDAGSGGAVSMDAAAMDAGGLGI